MKEFESHLNVPFSSGIKNEISVKKKQEVEYVLEGTIKPQKGQTVFELNEETGVIKPAEYKRDTIVLDFKSNSKNIAPEKLVINTDCVYIPALNAENAKKKYLKNKEQSFYFSKPPTMRIEDIYEIPRKKSRNIPEL